MRKEELVKYKEMTIDDYKESTRILLEDRDKRVINERKLKAENKRLKELLHAEQCGSLQRERELRNKITELRARLDGRGRNCEKKN